MTRYTVSTMYPPNVGSMLAYRRRRWANIKPALGEGTVIQRSVTQPGRLYIIHTLQQQAMPEGKSIFSQPYSVSINP